MSRLQRGLTLIEAVVTVAVVAVLAGVAAPNLAEFIDRQRLVTQTLSHEDLVNREVVQGGGRSVGISVSVSRVDGKPIGTVGGTVDRVTQYRAMGFDFLAIDSDLGLMMRACRNAVSSLTAQDTPHVHDLSSGTHLPRNA